jgi:hypothetical protein
MKKRILLFLLAAIIFMDCQTGDKQCTTKMPLNPNGDSELALIMREMYESHEIIARQIKSGDIPDKLIAYNHMTEAKSTEPDKAESPLYRAMSEAYLASVDNYNQSMPTDRHHQFETVVDNCMSCHKSMCPGPMVRIKKLYKENNHLLD